MSKLLVPCYIMFLTFKESSCPIPPLYSDTSEAFQSPR